MRKKEVIDSDELMQQLPCGIISFFDDGTIHTVNDLLLTQLGYLSSDLQNAKVERILSLASRIFYQTHLFPLLKLQGRVEEIFLTLKTKEEKEIPVLLFGNRVSTNGQWRNVCLTVPVSQRKKYEDEILRAKREAERIARENADLIMIQQQLEINTKLLDKQIVRLTHINEDYKELSKVIAHDLQEPIRKINIFTNIIKDHFPAEDKKRMAYFKKINESILRLSQLTESLGLYVDVDTSNETLQTISLSDTITASCAQAMQEMNFEEFELDIDELPGLKCFPDQIKQLFYQLIKNSIQFRYPNRKLKIAVTGLIARYNVFRAHENRYQYVDFAKIEVKDNAMGFSNSLASDIFRLFSKLEKDTPGIGFGLALCKKIVDNHFGTITCNSQPGEGTTFTILLPL